LIVSIHQPNYLAWSGFFHKLLHSDIFVIFDDVQLPRGKKNNFIIRNRIKTESGAKWLTIPVKDKSKLLPINQVQINNNLNWRERHWHSLENNYKKTPFFHDYKVDFQQIFEQEWDLLTDLNVMIIKLFMKILNIRTMLAWSSEINVEETGTEKILAILEKLNGDKYLSGSGPGSTKYLAGKEKLFEEKGIEIIYQKFEEPVYPQQFGAFIPNLSLCDMLFNVGKEKTMQFLSV